jgi:peptide/nickel transport system substrate-binding protein
MNKNLRISYWFAKAFFQRHGRLIFWGFTISFLIFLLLIKISPFLLLTYTSWQVKKIAVIGSFTPTGLPVNIQNYLSYGLTSLDSSGNAIPSLATDWTVKEEGLVYVFNLKTGLKWHDGSDFTANDVNYNLKDAKIEPITGSVLKITLKQPFSPLPTILSKPIFKKGLVGLGPYRVKRLKLKGDNIESIQLTPFSSGLYPLEYRFYPTESEAITAFKLGEVDVLEKFTSAGNFFRWAGVKVTSQVYLNYNVMLFFNNRLPLLQKRGVRQALSYAIPDFDEEKSFGPLNPNSWAANSNVKIYKQNLELAKSLLEKEGIASLSSQLTLSTFPSFYSVAEKISSAWQSLGLMVDIRVENTLPASFDALLVSQEIPADPDQYQLWHSTQPTNISGFFSLKVDKLLEDGRRTTDQQKRFEFYRDFQRYLLEEAPVAFLYHPKLYQITRK